VAAPEKRWAVHRASTWFLPWRRDPNRAAAEHAACGGDELEAMDPAPWAARPDLAVPAGPCHHSLPDSVMGIGVGDLVGGSVDWGGHFPPPEVVGRSQLEWWISIHIPVPTASRGGIVAGEN
jgi:hypothetical protein